MPSLPSWSEDFPDPKRLRLEVEAMADALSTALVGRLGTRVLGIWLKGSGIKSWDSPIDYVPELSDIDLHFRVESTSVLTDLDDMVAVHAEAERRFFDAIPDPLHIPRPQLMPADEESFDPPPPGSVRTLHGPDYPVNKTLDQLAFSDKDAVRLVDFADEAVIRKAILDLPERPSHFVFAGLRALNWRVSPIGARVLRSMGRDYSTVWSSNRSGILRMLYEGGQSELADELLEYYSSGWICFKCGWRDGESGRACFKAAINAIRVGGRIGREALDRARD